VVVGPQELWPYDGHNVMLLSPSPPLSPPPEVPGTADIRGGPSETSSAPSTVYSSSSSSSASYVELEGYGRSVEAYWGSSSSSLPPPPPSLC
jgi:hypothetical protein